MEIREAARLLGGDLVGGKILCPGPGHSRDDRSMIVAFSPTAPDGFTAHSFAGDEWTVCKDHVRSALGIQRERSPVEFRETSQTSPVDKIKFALRIWEGTRPSKGTIIETYLASRRINPPNSIDIRYHPALSYGEEKLQGMVALFRDIITDEPCGIHRTFLNPDGTKRDRKMLGRSKGAAIKIDADETVTMGIHIGEGIETCLAARQLDFCPAWALGAAVGIENFPVLPGLNSITYLGENDETGTNKSACIKNAKVQSAAGIEPILIWPDVGDLNDIA